MKEIIWSVTYTGDVRTGKSVSRQVLIDDERQGDEIGYDGGGNVAYFSAPPVWSWRDVPETVKKDVIVTLVDSTHVRNIEKILGVQQQGHGKVTRRAANARPFTSATPTGTRADLDDSENWFMPSLVPKSPEPVSPATVAYMERWYELAKREVVRGRLSIRRRGSEPPTGGE